MTDVKLLRASMDAPVATESMMRPLPNGIHTFSWLETEVPKMVSILALNPVSEARVTSKKEQLHVTTGNMMEINDTTTKPISPAMKRKMQEKYMRCRQPDLSQQAVNKTPKSAKKLKPMKIP